MPELLAMLRVAVSVDPAVPVEVQVIAKEQLAAAAKVLPQVVVNWKSLAFVPMTLFPLKVMGALPEFVNVTD